MLSSETRQRQKPARGVFPLHQAGWLKASLFNLVLLSLFFLSYHPFALTKVPSQPVADDRLPSSSELPNFHRVHSYLFRGGAPREGGLARLKEMGVKTIIDLRVKPVFVMAESRAARELGMNYVNLPTGNFIPPLSHQKIFFEILEASALDPAKAPVFVHCAHGSDRTGFLIALWRVNHDHWTCAQAGLEMLQRGFQIHKLHLPFMAPASPAPGKEAGQFD